MPTTPHNLAKMANRAALTFPRLRHLEHDPIDPIDNDWPLTPDELPAAFDQRPGHHD